ncbi:uncharacterized protein LOC129605043 isoform X1 [Betta splendens]|uniref:Uncharacterized protein LOC129605043 isoform X1 n=1 Tax=Betta splendens TaxID=158456 RepID=A0A9W2Y844_BETSP|nr:uncharacterized protein LOC129605043 isoform X1 [Betta splendens]
MAFRINICFSDKQRLFVVIQLVNNNNQHPPHVMSFRILTLISLISCVSGSLVVTVTQNHSITLEWTFTPKPDTITSVYIYCQLLTGLRASVLLHLHEGVEVSESQDQQFSGRVQFDRDELRDGRIRLQVSRLRTEDSGLYLCGVRTADGWSIGRCRLNVTAATDRPEPEAEPWESTVYCTVGLIAAALLGTSVILYLCFVQYK